MSQKDMVCWYCNKKGHGQKDCQKRAKDGKPEVGRDGKPRAPPANQQTYRAHAGSPPPQIQAIGGYSPHVPPPMQPYIPQPQYYQNPVHNFAALEPPANEYI